MFDEFKSSRLKKWTAWLLVLFMTFGLVEPMPARAEGETTDIQILATSDTHGKFLPYNYPADEMDKSGSMAQIAAAVKQLRQNNENTVVVDAGDSIQDNFSELFNDDPIHPMILAMKEIGYDTLTLGNHEFNYGVPKMQKIYESVKDKVLCGNVYGSDGNRLYKPYSIVEKGGVRIAIIGATTPNITKWDGPNLKGCNVTDPVVEVQKAIKEIKDGNKADVIIASVHMSENNEYDVPDSGVKDLADACPELDAIIAAHEHKGVNGAIYNGIKVVENKVGAQTLAQINIKVTKDADGKYVVANKVNDVATNLLNVKDYEADKDLSSKLSSYDAKAKEYAKIEIGKLEGGDLVPASEVKGIPTAQVQETAMINLINDVQMHYSGAKVSAAAAFSDKANIKAGTIRKCDVASIYKYSNTLYKLEMTGKQLKQYMEWSARYYNQYKDGDLTISFNQNVRSYNYDMFSGVKYDVDITKPEGQRIANLTCMDGKKINEDDRIEVAVNNYRANSQLLSYGEVYKKENGDTLPKLLASDIKTSEIGGVRELIGDYIQNVKGGTIKPVCYNNWKVTGNAWDSANRAAAVRLINDGKLVLPSSADGRTPNVRSITMKDIKDAGYKLVNFTSFNDLHGTIIEGSKDPGVAKVASVIKQHKQANPNDIVVSAGDNYQGSAMSNLLYGKPVSEFMKIVGVEASAVGNHDFDWGLGYLNQWKQDANIDFLASNIYDKNTGKPVEWAKPYKIVEKDGVKIGLIGVTTPETAYKTKLENVKNVEFKDPAEAASYWADQLKNVGVKDDKGNVVKADAVVAVAHMGGVVQGDKLGEGEFTNLMNNIKNVDAVISGHTHQPYALTCNNIPVVQGYYNGRDLGRLSMIVDSSNKVYATVPVLETLYTNKNDITPDKETADMVAKYQKNVGPILDEVVGVTDTDLDHDKVKIQGTSPLGYWTCDVMAKAVGAQIGITNGGGLRAPIAKGNITMGMLYTVMPFDNTLVKMELTGAQLKRVIENGIKNDSIGWVQVSGLKVYYNADAAQGNRITAMYLNDGTKIEDSKYYSVCTNDFMATGGDKYDFTGAKNVVDTGKPIRDALVESLKALGEKHLVVNYDQPLINGAAPADNGGSTTGTTDATNEGNASINLPKTGSRVDANALVNLGAVIAMLGVALMIAERERKRRNIA